MAEKWLPLLVNFSERERGIIRRMAQREKCSEAEYIRSAIMVDAFLMGDLKAMKLFGERWRLKLVGRLAFRHEGEALKA